MTFIKLSENLDSIACMTTSYSKRLEESGTEIMFKKILSCVGEVEEREPALGVNLRYEGGAE